MTGNPPPPPPPPPPPSIAPGDIENSFAFEFLRHPDFRATAGFLLGWVFWCSVSYAYKSQFFQLVGQICWNFVRRTPAHPPSRDVEARASTADWEKYSLRRGGRLAGVQAISNEAALVFTLNLCFAFASFAEFCSILAYDPGGADTACAFTVAWANMASQAARLIGLAILVLQLKQQTAKNVEFYCLSTALVVALSFILAFNATNTGDMVHIQTLGMSICVKIQYLPTALLTSIGFILLELYITWRFLGWDVYTLGWRAMLRKSANLRVARSTSLLLIDILIIAPNVVNTNVLAQFVPSSLAALVVLIVFNRSVNDSLDQRELDPGAPPSLQPSRAPTPLPVFQPSRQASPRIPMDSPVQHEDHGVVIIGNPGGPQPPTRVAVVSPSETAPSSAPPRLGDVPVFAEHQARQILPFQVHYAEQLDRHIHAGPIVPMRPKRQRPHVQVVIEDMEPERHSIIGSDILRLPLASASGRSGRRETKETKIWSPSTTTTPSDYSVSRSSVAATPTTMARHSNLSSATSTFNRSLSSGSRQMLSSFLSRQGSRNARSPAEPSLKMPWRAPRASFASGRTFGARPDELAPVAESNVEVGAAPRSPSWRGSQSSAKRPVISRPHSLRPSRPPSPLPPRPALHLPAVATTTRPPSSQHLTVPERVHTPTTPGTPPSIRSSSRYIVPTPTSPPSASYGRATGSGRLRGPRTPPMSGSSPNLRSAWPTAGEAPGVEEAQERPGHKRRRSGSCPELPPLEFGQRPLRPYPSVRR